MSTGNEGEEAIDTDTLFPTCNVLLRCHLEMGQAFLHRDYIVRLLIPKSIPLEVHPLDGGEDLCGHFCYVVLGVVVVNDESIQQWFV